MASRSVPVANARSAAISFDPLLLGAVLALVALGLVMVYSASAITAQDKLGDGFHYLTRQAIAAALGLVAMAVAAPNGGFASPASRSSRPKWPSWRG